MKTLEETLTEIKEKGHKLFRGAYYVDIVVSGMDSRELKFIYKFLETLLVGNYSDSSIHSRLQKISLQGSFLSHGSFDIHPVVVSEYSVSVCRTEFKQYTNLIIPVNTKEATVKGHCVLNRFRNEYGLYTMPVDTLWANNIYEGKAGNHVYSFHWKEDSIELRLSLPDTILVNISTREDTGIFETLIETCHVTYLSDSTSVCTFVLAKGKREVANHPLTKIITEKTGIDILSSPYQV